MVMSAQKYFKDHIFNFLDDCEDFDRICMLSFSREIAS